MSAVVWGGGADAVLDSRDAHSRVRESIEPSARSRTLEASIKAASFCWSSRLGSRGGAGGATLRAQSEV